MKQIQQSMNILPEECMAFGDNYNDIPMLDSVGHAYVMEKAVDDIKSMVSLLRQMLSIL